MPALWIDVPTVVRSCRSMALNHGPRRFAVVRVGGLYADERASVSDRTRIWEHKPGPRGSDLCVVPMLRPAVGGVVAPVQHGHEQTVPKRRLSTRSGSGEGGQLRYSGAAVDVRASPEQGLTGHVLRSAALRPLPRPQELMALGSHSPSGNPTPRTRPSERGDVRLAT